MLHRLIPICSILCIGVMPGFCAAYCSAYTTERQHILCTKLCRAPHTISLTPPQSCHPLRPCHIHTPSHSASHPASVILTLSHSQHSLLTLSQSTPHTIQLYPSGCFPHTVRLAPHSILLTHSCCAPYTVLLTPFQLCPAILVLYSVDDNAG